MHKRLAALAAATMVALAAFVPSASAVYREEVMEPGNGVWTCGSYTNATSPKPPTQGVVGQPADSCRVP